MHRADHVRGAERPAFSQKDVVDLLKRNACVFADEVYGVEDILDADHFDGPRTALTADDLTEGVSRGAVSAAGIDIQQGEFTGFQILRPSAIVSFLRASARDGSL